MGYIKEPKGIDFIIAPSILNDEDKNMFREAIAEYKKTGKTPKDMEVSPVANNPQQTAEGKKTTIYIIKKKIKK